METRKPSPVNKRPKRGPEREYFYQLFGKPVVVEFLDGSEELKGKLRWVDRFTLCVQIPRDMVTSKAGKDVVLYKHAVKNIYPD